MRAILLLLIAIALVGCRKERSITGAWQTNGVDQTGTLTFKPDGTFDGIAKSSLATLCISGTYRYEEDKLYRHVAEWQVKDYAASRKDLQAMNEVLSKDTVSVITWQDDDHFAIRSETGDFVIAKRGTQ